MTEQEAIKRLEAIYSKWAGDDELLHLKEDDLLLEIVSSLGWSDFIKKYDDAEHSRWCA